MKPKQRRELIFSKVFLLVLLVLALLFVVWAAWILPKNRESTIDSFEECVDAGYPVQESYPEVCAVPNGKRFPNPLRQ